MRAESNREEGFSPYLLNPFQNLFMKALSLTALLSWLLCHTWAQTSHSLINLKGTVVDSASGKPLAFATLVLQNAKTKAAG